MIFAPIIVILMAGFFLFFSISGMVSDISTGGSYQWDESALRTYARGQYNAIYTDADTYEDNIMILFLADPEDNYTYAYIGWVGDNINERVYNMYGNEYTALGQTFESKIPEKYQDSLSRNLSFVVDAMADYVGSGDHYDDAPVKAPIAPKFVNNSSLSLTNTTVQGALDDFYETTGISMSLVVSNMDAVFEKGLATGTIIMLVAGIALLALAIFLIIRAFKNKNNRGNPPTGGAQGGPNVNGENDPRYNPYSNMRF